MFDQYYLIETDLDYIVLLFLFLASSVSHIRNDLATAPAAVCGSQSVPASQECWLQL